MSGQSTVFDDHTHMLNRLVRIQRLGAHGADLGTQRMAHHLGEPFRCDDLDIVVEECEHRRTGLCHIPVIDRGEVERLRIVNQAEIPSVLTIRIS